VIWLKSSAGSGIMKSRKSSGSASTRSRRPPKIQPIAPAVIPTSEMRVRKSSAPNWPATNAAALTTTSARLSRLGASFAAASFARRCQAR